ncbi:Hypothetical Protein FCC1311_112552 [Hondaea fermentalgiana]|uniref:Uncharacterized protein n=1 Tax=Hondaea fermentalgiana TaxID=2315210 RepID=A0A2R5GW14_9STRA|nr:Hypothetical Protein FCC1311_112552 [Hondaea fermentalgiana]|eukprot:GBG35032.1 Hypothetical Protein FCC1311_112552 [Hondaea fermentalgiana]
MQAGSGSSATRFVDLDVSYDADNALEVSLGTSVTQQMSMKTPSILLEGEVYNTNPYRDDLTRAMEVFMITYADEDTTTHSGASSFARWYDYYPKWSGGSFAWEGDYKSSPSITSFTETNVAYADSVKKRTQIKTDLYKAVDSISKKTIRLVIFYSGAHSGAGGVTANMKKPGMETASHEAGHLLRLGHNQRCTKNSAGYYSGLEEYGGFFSCMAGGLYSPSGFDVHGVHRVGWFGTGPFQYIVPGKTYKIRSMANYKYGDEYIIGLCWRNFVTGQRHWFGYYPVKSTKVLKKLKKQDRIYGTTAFSNNMMLIAEHTSLTAVGQKKRMVVDYELKTYNQNFVTDYGLQGTTVSEDDDFLTIRFDYVAADNKQTPPLITYTTSSKTAGSSGAYAKINFQMSMAWEDMDVDVPPPLQPEPSEIFLERIVDGKTFNAGCKYLHLFFNGDTNTCNKVTFAHPEKGAITSSNKFVEFRLRFSSDHASYQDLKLEFR